LGCEEDYQTIAISWVKSKQKIYKTLNCHKENKQECQNCTVQAITKNHMLIFYWYHF